MDGSVTDQHACAEPRNAPPPPPRPPGPVSVIIRCALSNMFHTTWHCKLNVILSIYWHRLYRYDIVDACILYITALAWARLLKPRFFYPGSWNSWNSQVVLAGAIDASTCIGRLFIGNDSFMIGFEFTIDRSSNTIASDVQCHVHV